MLGQSKDLIWHGGREKCDLDVSWQVFEDVLDLGFETFIKHLISLVHDEKSEVISLEETFFHHIVDSTWSSNDDVGSRFEMLDVLFNTGSSYASVDFDSLVLTDRFDDKSTLQRKLSRWGNDEALDVRRCGIDALKGSNGESTSFTGSRLGLGNGIVTLDNWKNTFLLNWRWLVETITINTSQNFFLKAEIVEFFGRLVPVWFQVLRVGSFLSLSLLLGLSFLLLDFLSSVSVLGLILFCCFHFVLSGFFVVVV
jgi:hypothetical protein